MATLPHVAFFLNRLIKLIHRVMTQSEIALSCFVDQVISFELFPEVLGCQVHSWRRITRAHPDRAIHTQRPCNNPCNQFH